MIARSSRMRVPSAPLAALLLSAIACGRAGADCAVVPCPLPLALEVTVTAGATGAAAGASITVTGPMSGGGPCAGGVCRVLGTAGTYEVDVGAPGYQTVHRRVVVPGDSPDCGCPTTVPQRLTVALSAAA